SEESGIHAFIAGCDFPAASFAATVAAGTVCTATAAQRPSTWRCWLLKYVASRWIAGAISAETATCAVVVWPVQVARAEMVLTPSVTRRVAAIAAASNVSSAVLSLRLRPGRYRPPAPVRAVVTKSLTSREAQPGPGVRAGTGDVADTADPRVEDYACLIDGRLRTSMEPAHGLFMAEGEKVIRRAVAAGFGVRSMLVTRDKLAGLADLAGICPGPVYVITQ